MQSADRHTDLLLNDRALRSYVESIVGVKDRADDVLQAVAERLLKGSPPVQEPRRFLYTALRHAAIDELRASERRQRREADYGLMRSDAAASLEDEIDLARRLERLQDVLSELPLLTQALFRGFYLEGHSQAELAKHHGLHLSTVEKRLAKARRHCRRRLQL
ncbi:MAG: RNA polymerase sigma factor [Pseudomonadota bacterium]